ncbi:hypothetical protein MUO14_01325 [Halobacillus shinanisalinarum]|nr:hypothetical protein MUO14_01325 [Halobacillus shinanisalinarum]
MVLSSLLAGASFFM